MRTTRSHLTALLAAAVCATISCSEGPSGPSEETPEIALMRGGGGGGGSGDPTVSSVDPDSAEQSTTLDVIVHGNDFVTGSDVDWLIAGAATDKIVTNSTAFLNKKRLRANITVAADAPTVLYDARVTTPPGRRGIGSEVLRVKTKGPNDVIPLEVTVAPGMDVDDDDAAGTTPYRDGVGGVSAVVNPAGQFMLVPGSDAAIRQLCYDLSGFTSLFPDRIAADMPFDQSGFQGCAFGSLAIRDMEFGSGLRDMDSGNPATSSMLAGGQLRLTQPDGEGWIYILNFDQLNNDAPACVQGVANPTPEGEGFVVSMTSGSGDDPTTNRAWTIEPNPDPGASTAVLWRFWDQSTKGPRPKGVKPNTQQCIAIYDGFSFLADMEDIGP